MATRRAMPRKKLRTSTLAVYPLARNQNLAEALPQPCKSQAAQYYGPDKNYSLRQTREVVVSTKSVRQSRRLTATKYFSISLACGPIQRYGL